MSALALIAFNRGVGVSGCDLNPDGASDLTRNGVEVLLGHDANHIEGVRAVVYSSAIPLDHPELVKATELGIPVVRRAEALGDLVNSRKVVGIGGTHGKTTTTVMTTKALSRAGLDPTGVAGGRVAEWGGNVFGDGDDLYVVEADEYDKSFLALEPDVAVVNNVEADHLECFGSVEGLESAFAEFAGRANVVLLGADDRGANRLANVLKGEVLTVGMADDADINIASVDRDLDGTSATVTLPGNRAVDLRLVVPGLHNVRNAAMALGVTSVLGGDLDQAAEGLAEFSGVSRRFEVLGSVNGIVVVDDYAHHPTEVAAAIAAARQKYPDSRLVAVFQPHLYSRTKTLGDAFGIVLAAADEVVVAPIYAAREAPISGVTGESVVKAAQNAGVSAQWVPEFESLCAVLLELVRPGDVVVTLGAGDITNLGPQLIESMAGSAA